MTITDQATGTLPQPAVTPAGPAAGIAESAAPFDTIPGGRRSAIDTHTSVPVLDVTIPVYNEERDLEACLRRLHAYLQGTFPHPFRITVADNASTDGTLEVAERVARELREVAVVYLAEKGRGNALRKVWLASPSPVLAYMDVDRSTDLAALAPLLAPLISGHSDLAIGTRLTRNSRVVEPGRLRLGQRVYSAAAQAGSQDWTAWFFGSSDAANAITVDKPPASLWVMGLSVRVFGLSSWSILVPQALMGVATVWLVYLARPTPTPAAAPSERPTAEAARIADWVQSTFTAQTVDGTTLYLLDS